MSSPLVVAAVQYLNARPLWQDLCGRPEVQLELYSPSRCVERLTQGDCDVALIPTVELLRRPELHAVGRGIVAATDRARTVLLLAPCQLHELEGVVRDPNSRSSNALAEIVLRGRYGIEVPFVASPLAPAGASRIGRVLIGDAALRPPRAHTVLDLGTEWHEWTGLPFVFARWAVRQQPPRHWSRLLDRALLKGLNRRGEIAAQAAAESGLSRTTLNTYLRRDLSYEFGERHRESVDRLAGHLADLDALTNHSATAALPCMSL